MKQYKWVLLAVMLIVGLLCGCSSQKETPAENFVYELADGKVTITGFTGTDQEIYIPAKIENRPVTKIGESAFENYDMTLVVFPDTLEEIGRYAFADCNCLKSVTLPDTLRRVEEGAFYECKSLSEVRINEKLAYLGLRAFGECVALKEVVLPKNFDGFAREYKVKYASIPGVGMYAEHEGEAILDPVGSESTVLVVIEGSKAHLALEAGDWFYDIHYEVRNK